MISLYRLSFLTALLLLLLAVLGQAQVVVDDDDASFYFGGSAPDAYTTDLANRYTGKVFLPSMADSTQGAAVYWSVDDEFVYIAVAVRATGWLGFGLAEAGGMLGADMALFTAIRPTEIIDAYTLEGRRPITDDCQQDWELVNATVDTNENSGGGSGFLMIEIKRLLNTGDPQDHILLNDESTIIPPRRVIAAWGDDSEMGYHGTNRARGAIRFFGTGNEETTFQTSMAQYSNGTFELRASQYEIKTMETEYVELCITRDDLIAQGVPNTTDLLNVIGYEPILTSGSEPYVHHFVVSGTSDNTCNFMSEIAYVWAPGEHPSSLPDNLGAPLFGTDGFQAFSIQIHYNNPNLVEGVLDSSGVRFYYTESPREYQVGVLQTGDPFLYLYGQAVGTGLTVHEFDCPGTCSSQILQEPVTALKEMLHMHKTGVRVMNQQIRNNEVIRTGSIDVWDFEQNGAGTVLQQPFTIQPGDGFKTSCYYRNTIDTNDSNVTNASNNDEPSSSVSVSSVFQSPVFGTSSQEEMCIVFIFYYPRATLKSEFGEFSFFCGFDFENEPCKATHQVQDLANNDLALNRIFGVAQCLVDQAEEPTTTEPSMAVVLPIITTTPVAMDNDTTDATPTTTPVVGPTTPATAAVASSSSTSSFQYHRSTVLWVSLVSLWMVVGVGFTTCGM
jgi:hypothetical protein